MTHQVIPARSPIRNPTEREHTVCTTFTIVAEADSWIAVLTQRGWHSRLWTLHPPVPVLDFVEDLLLDVRPRCTKASR